MGNMMWTSCLSEWTSCPEGVDELPKYVDEKLSGCEPDVFRVWMRCPQGVYQMSSGCEPNVLRVWMRCPQGVVELPLGYGRDVQLLQREKETFQGVDEYREGVVEW